MVVFSMPKCICEEVFAQLWAAFNSPIERTFMEDNLPNLMDFMETVNDQVQDTEYSASSANAGAAKSQQSVQNETGRVPQSRQVPFRANRALRNPDGHPNSLGYGHFKLLHLN